MLAYEDNLLHTVAIGLVPIGLKLFVACENRLEFIFRHSGIPLSCLLERHLSSCLLEEVTHILLVLEVAHALGSYDALGPLACHKVVKQPEIHRTSGEEHPGADAILIAVRMTMLMVMTTMTDTMLVVAVTMVFMMMLMMMLVFVLMMMLVLVFVFVLVVVFGILDFLYPSSTRSHSVEVKHVRVENALKLDLSIVAVYNLRLRLDIVENLSYTHELVGTHFAYLIEQDYVAKLNLLNDKVGDVLLGEGVARQVETRVELVLQTQRIYYRADTVERRYMINLYRVSLAVSYALLVGTDSLRYGCRLADAAGLDDYIVETLTLYDVAHLLYEIHLERAADTTILECYERIVLLVDDSTLLYEVSVDVDLADVVDDYGKSDAAVVVEYAVEQGSLAAAQISGNKQNFSGFHMF